MPNNSKDLRIIKTYKLLSDSLLELLKTNSFEEIYVKDICKNAMINRSTFYTHFEDKYHLLTFGLNNIISDLTSSKPNSTPENIKEIIRNIFKHILLFDYLYKEILLNNQSLNVIFHKQIALDFEEKYKKNNLFNVRSRIMSNFYAGAILNVISWWLESNMEASVDEVTECLSDIIIKNDFIFNNLD